MSYRVPPRKQPGGYGPRAFGALLVTFVVGLTLFLAMRPLPFNECKSINSTLCACPKDAGDIKSRNLIVIDTTDPLRAGKYADIEMLISTFSGGSKSIWDWISDRKRADKTSIFLLGSEAPPDMQPVGTFCTLPPPIAMLASDFRGFELRQLEQATKNEIKRSIEAAVAATQAPRSPIIEALSIVTGNASHWSPGGNLILVSDLLQNTSDCGFFESRNPIPPFRSISRQCRSYVDNLQERLRPTKSYPGSTVVALCILPGKAPKDGLISFWRELFQQALSYDVGLSCDPQEIRNRRDWLAWRTDAAASKFSK